MNRPLVALGLALILAVVGWQIAAKERTLADGTLVLLELAPVDPRSLMQGDYMILRYALSRDMLRSEWGGDPPDDGAVVIRLDEHGVAHGVRVDDGALLEPGLMRLRYRVRRGRVRLGAESYFFEEGTAAIYEAARYGGLRVAPDGDSVLVGLYDAERRLLGPAE